MFNDTPNTLKASFYQPNSFLSMAHPHTCTYVNQLAHEAGCYQFNLSTLTEGNGMEESIHTNTEKTDRLID